MSFYRIILFVRKHKNCGTHDNPVWEDAGITEYVCGTFGEEQSHLVATNIGRRHLYEHYIRDCIPELTVLPEDSEDGFSQHIEDYSILGPEEMTPHEKGEIFKQGEITTPTQSIWRGGDGAWAPIWIGAFMRQWSIQKPCF